jgi:hypothetical protein
MRKCVFALLAIFCISALGQQADLARGIYARNGVLIGLTGLAPLRDCSVEAMEGKARSIKIKNGTVTFDLKTDTARRTFQFPLARLAPAERRSLRRNFLRKNLTLRATGYSCASAVSLETISIDRQY